MSLRAQRRYKQTTKNPAVIKANQQILDKRTTRSRANKETNKDSKWFKEIMAKNEEGARKEKEFYEKMKEKTNKFMSTRLRKTRKRLSRTK